MPLFVQLRRSWTSSSAGSLAARPRLVASDRVAVAEESCLVTRELQGSRRPPSAPTTPPPQTTHSKASTVSPPPPPPPVGINDHRTAGLSMGTPRAVYWLHIRRILSTDVNAIENSFLLCFYASHFHTEKATDVFRLGGTVKLDRLTGIFLDPI